MNLEQLEKENDMLRENLIALGKRYANLEERFELECKSDKELVKEIKKLQEKLDDIYDIARY